MQGGPLQAILVALRGLQLLLNPINPAMLILLQSFATNHPTKKPRNSLNYGAFFGYMAERAGFEPAIR